MSVWAGARARCFFAYLEMSSKELAILEGLGSALRETYAESLRPVTLVFPFARDGFEFRRLLDALPVGTTRRGKRCARPRVACGTRLGMPYSTGGTCIVVLSAGMLSRHAMLSAMPRNI